jgi:glutamyl-tRNA synthetase
MVARLGFFFGRILLVRTRFAPSPTGYMHIGNLRTALYAYLAARHDGGQLILRIEDTDRRRNVEDAVQVIYDSLKLAGLDYDEGPDKPGGVGPYVQSQRLPIYRAQAEQLVELGAAYRCFCAKVEPEATPEAIEEGEENGDEAGEARPDEGQPPSEAVRKAYDPCRFLAREEAEARKGESHVIRQRIPESGITTFVDRVYGTISWRNELLDDQVLLKSDGYPTYNFANVVDDHLMGITHVLRGVEYLSSTPKYNLLYEAFGWPIPEYVHLPHIVKEGGKKLSKRAGDASFQDLVARGYLPQAIVNYIALLGWHPADDREFFTLVGLVEAFDMDRINKSSAGFSIAKLDWLNGEHVRALPAEEFHRLAAPYYPPELSGYDTAALSRLIQPRVVRLTDIPEMVAFFVRPAAHDASLYVNEKAKVTLEASRHVLANVLELFDDAAEWTHAALAPMLIEWGKQNGIKTGAVMWPVRIALSGLVSTPGGATEIAEIIGKDETMRRIQAALKKLA